MPAAVSPDDLTMDCRHSGATWYLGCTSFDILPMGEVSRAKDDVPAYPQTIHVDKSSIQAGRPHHLHLLHCASQSRFRLQHHHLLPELQGDEPIPKRYPLSSKHDMRLARLRESAFGLERSTFG